MSDHHEFSLASGSRIDQYTILHQIGGGGFSIVYLAKEAGNGEEVIVKEYMPRRLAYRDSDGVTVLPNDEGSADHFSTGKRLFFQEANILSGLKHPNIVNVINFFRANGTVYMVMDYERGITLQDYIKRHKGGLSEKFLRTVFIPLLDGLKLIHNHGYLHLDIKPGNIYLRPGAVPILLDFGAVHEMQQSRKYQPGQVVTLGFSPYEQSNVGGYVGPWTDIYAIGATMRACIEGNAPPPAHERRMKDTLKPAVEAFRKSYSQPLLAAIDWAMEVDPEYRPQSVDQMLEALSREGGPEPNTPSGSESMLGRIANSFSWIKGQ